jgi:hypothetical protein
MACALSDPLAAFMPALLTAVFALIGALAEAIGGGRRLPLVRHSA